MSTTAVQNNSIAICLAINEQHIGKTIKTVYSLFVNEYYLILILKYII